MLIALNFYSISALKIRIDTYKLRAFLGSVDVWLYFHFSSIFSSVKAKNKRIARLRHSFLTQREGKSGKRGDNHQMSTEPSVANSKPTKEKTRHPVFSP
jgi:hypothetical protein